MYQLPGKVAPYHTISIYCQLKITIKVNHLLLLLETHVQSFLSFRILFGLLIIHRSLRGLVVGSMAYKAIRTEFESQLQTSSTKRYTKKFSKFLSKTQGKN